MNIFHYRLGWIVGIVSVLCLATLQVPGQAAVEVKLAENGRALLPVVVSAQASEAEKTAANTLAQYLKRISGEFQVETSSAALTENTPGIVVGVASRFTPALTGFKTNDPTATEDYLLRSHARGVLLAGASELAVQHAVWDFLYRLGHRQFFPGETWEIVPSASNLSLSVDTFESPSYSMRMMAYGGNTWGENRVTFATWRERNRMAAGLSVSTGHNFGNIIRRHQAQFTAHPEYLALVKGERASTKNSDAKFCISNAALRQLVIDDALAEFAAKPQMQSYSIEPSDGGGWCECPQCAALGSISDQQVTLANAVAQAVDAVYPNQKYVGMYAYHMHSPPPSIAVHPRVVASIATSFISGGFNVNQLVAGWNEKGAVLGVREYWSVYPWDYDLPGRSRISNSDYMKTTVPHFYSKGARFYRTEASENWGPHGLGYYLASRLLWDINDANQIEALTNDFLDKAFGTAREPMAEFYRLIDGSGKPLLSTDLIGRLYRQLDQALKSTQDAAVIARLHDLALYVRYVEMYTEYSQAGGAARQTAFENLLRYGWRIRPTHMIHTYALWRGLDGRDTQVKFPAGSGAAVPADKDPLKSSEPFTTTQIQSYITQGIASNALLEFTPKSFSNDLVPATALALPAGRMGSFPMLRGNRPLYTWVGKAPGVVKLTANGGLIYPNRGDVRFELFPQNEAEGKSVAKAEVAPDKAAHEVVLPTEYDGMQRLVIIDGSGGTNIKWPEGQPLVFESSLDEAPVFAGGYWSLYFYVPKGTKVVGGYRTSVGRITSPDGKTALALTAEGAPGFWQVPVGPGQDGKLWQYTGKGQLKLMTVPPYLTRSAQELMLPREVVEVDSKG